MPQAVIDGWNAHPDVKLMFTACMIVSGFNFMAWLNAAKDPRFYFGSDMKNNYWKKYMSTKMWTEKTGLGIGNINPSDFWWNGKNPAYPSEYLDNDRLGFKQAWRRDLYRLICDIESADPANYPLN